LTLPPLRPPTTPTPFPYTTLFRSIKDDLKPAKLDWVTALRGPAIKALMAGGTIQPTLFDEQDMAEITSPDYPGERLIACCNPFLDRKSTRLNSSHVSISYAVFCLK